MLKSRIIIFLMAFMVFCLVAIGIFLILEASDRPAPIPTALAGASFRAGAIYGCLRAVNEERWIHGYSLISAEWCWQIMETEEKGIMGGDGG